MSWIMTWYTSSPCAVWTERCTHCTFVKKYLTQIKHALPGTFTSVKLQTVKAKISHTHSALHKLVTSLWQHWPLHIFLSLGAWEEFVAVVVERYVDEHLYERLPHRTWGVPTGYNVCHENFGWHHVGPGCASSFHTLCQIDCRIATIVSNPTSHTYLKLVWHID